MHHTEKEKYTCDICNKKIITFDKGNTFYYHHVGEFEVEGHVCDKCKDSKLRRRIAYKFAK